MELQGKIANLGSGQINFLSKDSLKEGSEEIKSSIKRCNFVLPGELYNELKTIAKERHTTVVELLRRFILLGLLAMRPEGKLVYKEGNDEKEILLI